MIILVPTGNQLQEPVDYGTTTYHTHSLFFTAVAINFVGTSGNPSSAAGRANYRELFRTAEVHRSSSASPTRTKDQNTNYAFQRKHE